MIYDYVSQVWEPFLNPQKRVFLGYLATSLIIAAVLIFFQIRRYESKFVLAKVIRDIFSRRIWLSSSAIADYKILLISRFIMLFIAPALISTVALTTLIFEWFHLIFDGRVSINGVLPNWTVIVFFSLTLFLIDDWSKYIVHKALHRIPLLWCFHKVHHTAEVLTPFTVYRTHPVEAIIFALRSVLSKSIVLAIFVYFFGSQVELLSVIGVSIFLFIFNLLGANLRHSQVWLSYGKVLERWFISPSQHQVHHSYLPQHIDKNYGAVLAIWDRIGGSLYVTSSKKEQLPFGILGVSSKVHSIRYIYGVPLWESLMIITSNIQILVLLFKKIKIISFLKLNERAMFKTSIFTFFACVLLGLTLMPVIAKADLNIYSHRQPFLIAPFIEAYKKMSGTQVNVVYASKGLAQRLQAEGSLSPADVILTVDIARLSVYADKDLLAPVKSSVLESSIPKHLRDKDGKWFAFSKRARVIAVSKSSEDANKIKNYEDLADPKWKGRICSRPGSHVYNRALLASIIYKHGEEGAKNWAKSLQSNFARRPQGNDRAQVKGIKDGVCDIAIINHYYYGKLKFSEKTEHRMWADKVNLIFPNQLNRGTHINISGGGIAKYSQNKVEAQKFLEFLTSNSAQNLYASINFEYPVNVNVTLPAELESWGKFKEDQMPIGQIALLAPEAQKIIDVIGW